VVALAVAGGIALQMLFFVALFASVGMARPTIGSIPTVTHVAPPADPVRPRVQACELFYAWEKTHNLSLLNHAVTDSYSSRVPRLFRTNFRADLTSLRGSTLMNAHSPLTIRFKHAVQDNCKQIKADLDWRHRPAFRKAIAQFSRYGTASLRSADSAQQVGPGRGPGAPG
jgi:hypothetical protein